MTTLGERILYEAQDSIDEFHVNADGSLWLAVLFGSGERSRVIANGQDVGRFDAVQDVMLSPDGRHIAFKAEADRRQCVVLDGKTGDLYLEVNDLMFGPRGLTYRAEIFGKQFIVENGQEGQKFEEIAGLGFSPDGRLAFSARNGKEWRAVIGGEEKAKYERVGRPAFSPDGTRLAYTARAKNRSFVVLDEKPLAEYEHVNEPVFLPDGSGVAYTAVKDEDTYVIIGEQVIGPFQKAETPVMARDRQVFLFQRDGTQWVWDSGREFGPYEVAAYPVFGPDGTLLFVCEFNGKRVLVMDGNPASDKFDEILSVAMDPTTRAISFSAREGRQRFIVVNGNRQKPYDLVDSFQTIPPSSFWYRAKVGRQWRVVIGRNEGPLYDTVGLLAVSDDRKSVTYRATRGNRAVLVSASVS